MSFEIQIQQLRAILWKAAVIRKRHYITLAFEIVVPLALILLVVFGIGSGGDLNAEVKNIPDEIPLSGSIAKDIVANDGFEPPTIYSLPVVDVAILPFQLVGKSVLFTPNNKKTRQFVDKMQQFVNPRFYESLSSGSNIDFSGVDSEQEIDMHLTELNNSTEDKERFVGGIVFMSIPTNFSDQQSMLHYKIRVKSENIRTTSKWAAKREAGPSWSNPYTFHPEAFTALQVLINEVYLNSKAEDMGLTRRVNYQRNFKVYRIPYPKYRSTPKSSLVALIPSLIVVGFVVAFPTMVKRIADEKHNGSREMFRMMGLSDWIYWIGNFLHNLAFNFILTFILLCLLYFHITGGVYFFTYSSFGPLFVLFLIYSANVVLFGFLVSIPFTNPVPAVVLAVVTWIGSSIPSHVMDAQIGTTSNMKRLATCLLPNSALNWALQVVSQKEVTGEGLHFYNINDQTAMFESMTFLLILVMMLVSCGITSFLVWYLDNVWPFQPGVPKKPWFLFTQSYWNKKADSKAFVRPKDTQSNPNYFEAGDETKPVAIRLSHVTKKYGGVLSPRKVAVSDLSIDVYEDQLTCLLGHNGAGKTTTMSMITGMFPPSNGKIYVNGYDLFTQTSQARRSMSFCPQHNPLYTELTVREHLYLYAKIKGIPDNHIDTEVAKTVREITLEGHEDKLAPNLSGGMKRKLCLGIALVGGTKVVILDEPTSGLDVEVRRSIWDVLRESRKTRTILLSTHDMEEADALSDRIIIMSEGHVTCAGSTLFLKRAFGAGYVLRIAKSSSFHQQALESLVLRFFPESKLKTNVGTEISYSLESHENATDYLQLPLFFKDLEYRKNTLGIESFGLSITTMEDVFLKVGELAGVGDEHQVNGIPHISSADELTQLLKDHKGIDRSRSTGWQLEMQRAKGLFLKRFNFGKRYWTMAIFQILIPGILFICGFSLQSSIFDMMQPQPALEMNLFNIYGRTNVFYQSNDSSDFLEFYKGVVKEEKQDFTVFSQNVSIPLHLVNISEGMSLNDFVRTYIVGLDVSKIDSTNTRVNAWASMEADHSIPLAIDLVYKALEYQMTNKSKSQFMMTNQPLPVKDELLNFKISMEVMDFLWCLILPITVPFLAASYILFPVHERTSKAKLVQIMTGLHRSLLHFVNFVFDFILHVIATIVIIGVFAAMDTQEFFTRESADVGSMMILLLMFGVASIILAYIFSNVFSSQSSGFTFMVMIYLITGLVFAITSFVLRLLSQSNDNIKDASEIVLWFFRIFPIFSMQIGFRKIYRNGGERSVCNSISPSVLEKMCKTTNRWNLDNISPELAFAQHCCPESCKLMNNCVLDSPLLFDERGIGKELAMMFVSIIISCILLFLVEANWQRLLFFMKKPTSPVVQLVESDVIHERDRIQTIVEHKSFSRDAIAIDTLTKKFSQTFAVKGLSFGVHQKECFGLLGVNGAGKTTTFSMITGDLFPSFGNAYQSSGLSVVGDTQEYQQQLGYCPQFDPLLDKLSGREMLELFARLRGLQDESISVLVTQLINLTDLQNHADRKTESFSGGNKRKLSLAIALMANPEILLLDEPTSGVDPGARRKIWATLSHVSESFGCSIILTSHSMQECEALCQRIGIMVSGQLRCLGSAQHLRSKYGQGYTIVVKLKRNFLADVSEMQSLKDNLTTSIPGVLFTDQHETVWTLRVPDPSVKWSTLFEVMQKLKDQFDFEDYTISDTTLEQIFVGFARTQHLKQD